MPDDEAPERGEEAPEASEEGVTPSDEEVAGASSTPSDEVSTGGAEEAAVPALSPEHERILARLQADLGDAIVEAASNHGDLLVRVRNDAWHRAAEAAKSRLDCEYLSFISAVDWMPRPDPPTWDPDAPSAPVQPKETTYGVTGSEGRFQVFAVVESTDDKVQVIFKTDVDEQAPLVASWTDVYPGADWHERECWEMYGIRFDGHPHLRHLYLPGEFEGHPLRKDFPLLAREVKPWPGLVDVELMPGAADEGDGEGGGSE